MTVKQWLEEKSICGQTYYHRLKRILPKTYKLATTSADTACVKTVRSEIAFAGIPLPAMNPAMLNENGFHPGITIQTGSVLIGVSNTASAFIIVSLCIA